VKKMAKKVADAAGKVGKKLKIGDKVEGDGLLGSGAAVELGARPPAPRLEGGPGGSGAGSIDVGRVRSLKLGVNSQVNPLGVMDRAEEGGGESVSPAVRPRVVL
jgi:hypothetical protein